MEYYIYWGLFCLAMLVVAFIIVIILGIASEIFKFELEDKAVATYFLTLFLTSGPVSYYTLEYFGFKIPNKTQTTAEVSLKANELNDKVKSLNKLVDNPDDIKLSELPKITEKVTTLVEEVKKQSEEQATTISNLVLEIERERKKADEAKTLISHLQSMTSEQLNAVKWVLTEDAKEEAKNSLYINLLSSFIFGVFASLIASWLFKRFGQNITRTTAETIKHEAEKI